MKVIRITDLAAVAAIGVLIAAALLALMLTSAGSAAGSPSTLGTGPSGFASLSTSTASANCSKAAAREVVERLGMSISEPSADPIGKVLCGAFTGPGQPGHGRHAPRPRQYGVRRLGGLPLGWRHMAVRHEAAGGRIDHCRWIRYSPDAADLSSSRLALLPDWWDEERASGAGTVRASPPVPGSR